jgi:hypothetical protein
MTSHGSLRHSAPSIRPATAADATAIAELLGHLGYPATTEEVLRRLENLRYANRVVTVVAETGGSVTGVATGHVFHSIQLDANRGLAHDARRSRARYTWVAGGFIDTVVTFTLTPTPSGTKLRLVQSGFKANQKQNFGGARYGWKMMGGRLVDLLERIP